MDGFRVLVPAVALMLLVADCRPRVPSPAPEIASEPAPEPALEDSAALVIARNAGTLMAIPGVVGLYEGETQGKTVLRVMVLSRADSTLRRIPKTLEGYPVEIEVSGPIKPMKQ